MSSKIFTLAGFNASSAFDAAAPKFTSSTSLKCLLQLAPTVGGEIIAWGINFDNNTANTPVQVELCEVDVPATGGTASQLPASYVTTAISSTSTTTLDINAAIAPSGTTAQYQIGTLAMGGLAGGGEQMLVSSGQATTALTVVRGINGTASLSSIPVGTIVYACPGTGCPGDIAPAGSMPSADPTWATCALAGTGLTGFNFTSAYPSTVKNLRIFDPEQIPPTAPYIVQLPPERGWEFFPGRYVQIRITASATVDVMPWMTFII